MATEPDPPIDAEVSTQQPPEAPEVHSVLTPEGEIQSVGRFARGLGQRRAKLLVFGAIGLTILMAITGGAR